MKAKGLKRFVPVLLIIIGLVAFSWGAYVRYSDTVLSFSAAPEQVSVNTDPENPLPVSIKIDQVSIELPITQARIENDVWEISPDGASHLSSSAAPGDAGNIVIYAHNKYNLFGKIRSLSTGQVVNITTQDGVEHEYEIIETKTVSPEQIDEVLPTDTEILTLYTCTGFFDSQRFIVKATPKR